MVESRGPLLERMLCAIGTEYTFEQWTRDFPPAAADTSAEETHGLAVTLMTELRDLERPWSESLFLEWLRNSNDLCVSTPAILATLPSFTDINSDETFGAAENIPAAPSPPLD